MLTVLTAAGTQDLTTVAAVKAELGLTDSAKDSDLLTLIHEASGAIAAKCGRVFASEQVQEIMRLDFKRSALQLERVPIAAVTSVIEDGTALGNDEYEFDAKAGLLYRLSSDARTFWTAAKIIVTYTGGYVLLIELPFDLERACKLLVKAMWFARERDPLVKSEQLPGVLSTDYWVGGVGEDGAMPPDVAALIEPYRNYAFG